MSNRASKSGRVSLSRRQFVAAASTALAAPMIIPSGVLGNDKVAAANSRIGVGFIGMGKQVGGHVNGMLSKKNVQVLAVCEVDTTRREYFKQLVDDKHAEFERKDIKACAAYVDYKELLARQDIDAVFITTPDHWHAAIAIEACKAKKDIYCEKPLTLSIGEGKALIEAVRKYERVLQTGSQQRSEGPFRQAVDLIRNGRIGKVTQINVGIGVTSKPCDLPAQELRSGLEWNTWLGQAPERPYNEVLCRNGLPDKYPFNPGWRDYTEYSGGYVTDWGAHHFDIVQWALDMDSSGPVEILPPEKEGDKYGASFIYRGSPAGDEIKVTHVNGVYEYKGVDKDGKPTEKKETNGILFIGEKGKIFVNRGVLISEPDTIKSEPLPADAKKVFASPGHRDNWLDCIASRQRPICDVEVGARSVTVCHLVNLAYWHNRKLTWDPKQWQFTGDNAAEANKWINRERRKGFELPTI